MECDERYCVEKESERIRTTVMSFFTHTPLSTLTPHLHTPHITPPGSTTMIDSRHEEGSCRHDLTKKEATVHLVRLRVSHPYGTSRRPSIRMILPFRPSKGRTRTWSHAPQIASLCGVMHIRRACVCVCVPFQHTHHQSHLYQAAVLHYRFGSTRPNKHTSRHQQRHHHH